MNVYHISIGDKSFVSRRLFLSNELAEIRLRHLFGEKSSNAEIVKVNCLNAQTAEKIPDCLFVRYSYIKGCFELVSTTTVNGYYLDRWPLVAKIVNPVKGETTQKFFANSGARIDG